MSYYEFHFGNALTLAQLVSSLCFMHVMKKMHLIDYKSFNKNIAKQVCSAVKQARTLSFRVRRVVMFHHFFDVRSWRPQCIPLAGFFVSMVVLSLVALPFINIPMYNTLRRLSTLLLIVIEYLFVPPLVAHLTQASFGRNRFFPVCYC